VGELAALIIQSVAGIVLPACIVKWDESHLGPDRLRRAWPPASFWCAVVAFGIFCLPFHFLRTRGVRRGLALGLGWLVLAAGALLGLGMALGS